MRGQKPYFKPELYSWREAVENNIFQAFTWLPSVFQFLIININVALADIQYLLGIYCNYLLWLLQPLNDAGTIIFIL